jgi:uncharacterized membrane protein
MVDEQMDRPRRGIGRPALALVLAAVLAGAEIPIALGAYLPFLCPLVGFAAAVVVPLVLVHRLLGRRPWFFGGERVVVATALTLLLVMLAALADNFALPLVGVSRPLDTWPVFLTADLLDTVLLAVAWRTLPDRWSLSRIWPSGWRDGTCIAVATLTVPLAAMGAVRINNGAGSGLTLFTIALVVLVMIALLRWRDLVDFSVAPWVIYSVSLALLFVTSLRGWYTTGHDVQHEMLEFLTTQTQGLWTTGIHDGYNSCLSITILPTVLQHWTGVSDPYVYKVFFQVIYAVCPVAVYYVGRRITSDAMSIVSTFFFIGFVGYMQDMPMLNRQEMGFVFFSAGLLVLLMTERTRRWRWSMLFVLGTGMVISHYSTTYYALASLFAAVALRFVALRLLPRILPWWRRQVARSLPGPVESLIAWRVLFALLAVAVVWNGPINHSGGALVSEVGGAVNGVFGGNATRSADVAYSVAGPGRGTTQTQAYDNLLAAEAHARSAHLQYFTPAPEPSAQLTPLAPTDTLKVTTVGKLVDAAMLNRVWRTAAAWGLQLLLALGLAVVLLRRRLASMFPPDMALLGLSMVALLVVQVVLPSISLDYGVGRSFMQALMVLGPFTAMGAAALGGWFAPRWRVGLAFSVAAGIFVSTSGLVPQLTGGYGAQLHLNNAGDYYDRFMLHPQEVTAVDWLKNDVIAGAQHYPDIQVDTNLFNESRSLGGLRAYDDIYPSDIRRDAYVVLGWANVVEGKDLEVFDGYELWLQYPTTSLRQDKSLVYNNGSTQIYR